MIPLLIAARAVIVLLRSLARARAEALEPLPDPRVKPLKLVQIRELRAKAWSALAELGRLAAAAPLELPLAVRRVVAMWGEEDAEHDEDAWRRVITWVQPLARGANVEECAPCSGFGFTSAILSPGGRRQTAWCLACAGIGYALPDAPAKASGDVCASRRAAWFAMSEDDRLHAIDRTRRIRPAPMDDVATLIRCEPCRKAAGEPCAGGEA